MRKCITNKAQDPVVAKVEEEDTGEGDSTC
jgi:hypothetical protein